MNDIFTDMHNPIFDILIKHTHVNNPTPLPSHQPLTVLPPPPTTRSYATYIYTDTPQQAVQTEPLRRNIIIIIITGTASTHNIRI
jgi:hypothetical protein